MSTMPPCSRHAEVACAICDQHKTVSVGNTDVFKPPSEEHRQLVEHALHAWEPLQALHSCGFGFLRFLRCLACSIL